MDTHVREAVPADLGQLLEWSAKFAEWAGVDADMGDVGHTLLDMMERPGFTVAMHDRGFIAGGVMPMWMNRAKVAAEELMWWADGNGIALLDHFEKWAADNGADLVVMIQLPNNGAVLERLYRRKGYAKSDTKFMKVLA